MRLAEHRTVRGALRRATHALAGGRIRGGPFRGMRYIRDTCGSLLPPKLVGTYECEIAPWIDRVCTRRWTRLVDLGCAEGYYAVGLATRIPDCPVVAYDLDPTARAHTAALARLNGVLERLDIRGAASVEELAPLLGHGTFLLSDIEGAEYAILDPVLLPALRDTTLVVEIHPNAARADRSIEAFAARFGGTHTVARVDEVARPVGGAWAGPLGLFRVPGVRGLVQFEARISETRRGEIQAWLLCEPHPTG